MSTSARPTHPAFPRVSLPVGLGSPAKPRRELEVVDDDRWHRLHAIATFQRGMVSTAQLAHLGFDKDAIYRFSRRGMLTRRHRGVYSVGHDQRTFVSRCWAAALAVGADSALSHRTAAWLLGLIEQEPRVIDLTVFRGHRRSRSGVLVHESNRSGNESRRVHGGLVVTSPAWTLLDCGPQLGPTALRQAVRTAMVKHDASLAEMRRLLETHRPAGTSALRHAIDDVDDPGMYRTRGALERRFLTFVIAHGLPRPNVNVPLLGYEVDFLWEPERLVVETDDRLGHTGTDRQVRDARRDATLQDAGYRIIRVTSSDLDTHAPALCRTLRAALGLGDELPV